MTQKEYVKVCYEYSHALNIARTKVNNALEDINVKSERNLVDIENDISTRIKTYDSFTKKCERKGLLDHEVDDVAGIKIVCNFEDDIPIIFEMLKTLGPIKDVSNYIDHPKENGYRALHVVMNFKVAIDQRPKFLPVEIQVKTKLQDALWSLEHIVVYKNDNPSPEAEKNFRNASEKIAELDKELIAYRDFGK